MGVQQQRASITQEGEQCRARQSEVSYYMKFPKHILPLRNAMETVVLKNNNNVRLGVAELDSGCCGNWWCSL